MGGMGAVLARPGQVRPGLVGLASLARPSHAWPGQAGHRALAAFAKLWTGRAPGGLRPEAAEPQGTQQGRLPHSRWGNCSPRWKKKRQLRHDASRSTNMRWLSQCSRYRHNTMSPLQRLAAPKCNDRLPEASVSCLFFFHKEKAPCARLDHIEVRPLCCAGWVCH